MNVCVYVCSPVRYTTPEIAHCTQIKTAEYSIGQAKMHATLELVSTHANVPRVVAGFWVLDLPTVGILAPVRMIWYQVDCAYTCTAHSSIRHCACSRFRRSYYRFALLLAPWSSLCLVELVVAVSQSTFRLYRFDFCPVATRMWSIYKKAHHRQKEESIPINYELKEIQPVGPDARTYTVIVCDIL